MPHRRMSANHPSPRGWGGRGGAHDGRAQSGDEDHGEALPQGEQDREDHDARRAVRVDRVDPGSCPSGPSCRCRHRRHTGGPGSPSQDLRPGRRGAAPDDLGHPERSVGQAPGAVHGRDRGGPRTSRRDRAHLSGTRQAAADLGRDDRPPARTRAGEAPDQGALGHQAGHPAQAPDPDPDLRRLERPGPGVLRG